MKNESTLRINTFLKINTDRIIVQFTTHNTNNVTSSVTTHLFTTKTHDHNFTSHNITIHHHLFTCISQINTCSTLHLTKFQ